MLATIATAFLDSSPIFGCMLWISAGRSECACDHSAWTFLPTTGHSATLAGGAGICRVLSRTLPIRSCTESPSEASNTRRRRDDQHQACQHQQRRRQALPAAQSARQHLLRGIERDRQDQCPRHQREEGREHPVAQHHQRDHEGEADVDVEKPAGQPLFERRDRVDRARSWVRLDPSRLAGISDDMMRRSHGRGAASKAPNS